MPDQQKFMGTIDEDLSQLESDIRRLKIEYEQYFGGGRQRPPSDTQWRVEQMIKRYADRMAEINFAQRFRYNNLAQTYAKYQDMWRKKLAQKESGFQQHHYGAAAKAIEAERAKQQAARTANGGAEASNGSARTAAAGGSSSFSMSFSNPENETDKIETLYRKLLEVRQEAGEKSGAPTLKDFEKFVRQKTTELKQKGGREVEYIVSIESGRVRLKARLAN
jgi:hypothetical protein